MISTTCRDEWPAGSSVSAGSGPSGPGGGGEGDGSTEEVGFVLSLGFFLDVSGLGFGLDLSLGLHEATLLFLWWMSPELAQLERSRRWDFLGSAATVVATSSAAVDLQWKDRVQLPVAIGRRRSGGGFSGMTRSAASSA